MTKPPPPSIEDFNARSKGYFPAHLGISVTHIGQRTVDMEMPIRSEMLAPNDYLHAGAIITLADTASGYGCIANLPEGSQGFTTVEIKSNHLGTAREGHLKCHARAAHVGRTTQVWDATVTHAETGKTLALFRCTQMILWPK